MAEVSQTIDLGEDDGFVTIKVAGGEVRLDLWAANNRIYEHHEKNKSVSDCDYCDGLVRVFMELGLPELSHRLAQRLVEQIHARVEQLKKTPE